MSLTNGNGAGAFGLPLHLPGPNVGFPVNETRQPVMQPGGGQFGQDGRLAGLLGQVQAFRDARHDWLDGGREGDRLSAFLQQYRQQQGFASRSFAPRDPASY